MTVLTLLFYRFTPLLTSKDFRMCKLFEQTVSSDWSSDKRFLTTFHIYCHGFAQVTNSWGSWPFHLLFQQKSPKFSQNSPKFCSLRISVTISWWWGQIKRNHFTSPLKDLKLQLTSALCCNKLTGLGDIFMESSLNGCLNYKMNCRRLIFNWKFEMYGKSLF